MASEFAVYASQCRSPDPTQDSLPGAGQALPDGLSTRRAPTKGFKLTSCSLSSFPKLAWRNPLLCSRVSGKTRRFPAIRPVRQQRRGTRTSPASDAKYANAG